MRREKENLISRILSLYTEQLTWYKGTEKAKEKNVMFPFFLSSSQVKSHDFVISIRRGQLSVIWEAIQAMKSSL